MALSLAAQTEQTSEAPANVVAVDLGLPSGTRWANVNIGASSPEEYGDYYAWGETEEKSDYSKNTYLYWNEQYNTGDDIGEDISGTQYDVAHVKWGGIWKMPTLAQIKELIENSVCGRKS